MVDSLAQFQSQFSEALTGGKRLPEKNEEQIHSIAASKRFDVYRNNVYSSLIDALATTFPAVERLVGQDFFRATARAFLANSLPQRGTLLGFGAGFPEFLVSFPPAQGLPYLGDIARLELLWLEAFHAEDARSLSMTDLSESDPSEFADIPLRLHPSLRWISSIYPIVEIWRTNREDDIVRPVTLIKEPQSWIVLRAETRVLIYLIPAGGRDFLSALREGKTVGEAIEHMSASEDADLYSLLSNLIGWGAFAHAEYRTEKQK